MSTSNPNITANINSETSLNSLLVEVISNLETPTTPKSQRDHKNKRKPSGQLSEEKVKPSKITNTCIPPAYPSTQTMHTDHPRPRMLQGRSKTPGKHPMCSSPLHKGSNPHKRRYSPSCHTNGDNSQRCTCKDK